MKIANENEYRYWKTVRAIGITMLLFLLFLNLFSLMMELLNWVLRLTIAGTTAKIVISQTIYAAGYLTSFMLPVVFLRRFIQKSGYPYRPMRANASVSPWIPLMIFAGIAVIWSFAYLNTILVSIFNYSEFSSSVLWEDPSEMEWYRLVLSFLTMCVVPAFCEEFLFRGAILTNCLPFGRGTAILISALLFGLMHQNAEQILYAFAAGIVLGLIYERTGSIWNCVLLHLFNNFFSTFQSVFLQGLESRYQVVGSSLFEGILFAAGLLSAAILILHFAPRKPEIRDGVFGKTLPASDEWASSPVPAKRAIRLFLNLPMVLFLVFAILSILYLIVVAVLFYG